jgi:RNA polymerase sigma-70 factor (ECF subfamily)
MAGDPAHATSDEPERLHVRRVGGQAEADLIAVYEQYHDPIYAFLRRATRDQDVAEDLLQETFARLLVSYRAGRPPEQLRPWLYRVASNLVTSRGRRLRTITHWLAGQRHDDHFGAAASPETSAISREWSSEVADALGTLSEESRTALLLAAQGFVGREIADAIGRSEAATRTLMCRARQQMRREIERREVAG